MKTITMPVPPRGPEGDQQSSCRSGHHPSWCTKYWKTCKCANAGCTKLHVADQHAVREVQSKWNAGLLPVSSADASASDTIQGILEAVRLAGGDQVQCAPWKVIQPGNGSSSVLSLVNRRCPSADAPLTPSAIGDGPRTAAFGVIDISNKRKVKDLKL